jgi:hypothetical protein
LRSFVRVDETRVELVRRNEIYADCIKMVEQRCRTHARARTRTRTRTRAHTRLRM